ncbi:MAG: general secretion pathway protein GspB [Gammaproteobacteria bacterium]|jgi:general secretion pathway protein B|nr:general secretion pathway protein GspB [Gammaproteobacteria bacterium]MDP6617630.1 general secretion pathway protein GspB [Gammaproteobacteria bacterium]MDP6694507.1 general secretion pathway protein GspB [Gammaproteobacteria bacterium]MDP7041083.1 general secretion pathway protein GspB [Gammaproteobacteria bacterium]
MSFILDALRKSENERRRNEVPGLADSRVQQKGKKRGFWIPLVALLIGINISLLAVMWLTGDRDSSQPRATPGRTATSPPEQPRSTAPRRLEAELKPEPVAEAAPPPPAKPAPADIPSMANTMSVNLPTLTDLLLDGSITLQPLRLDIHVYSEKPGERFVFINMSKYHEGERTSEGPTVTEINTAGVVLNHQGRDFLLLRE